MIYLRWNSIWAISNPKRQCHENAAFSMPANLESSAVLATGLEKVSFHSNPKERQCQECSNYCTIALISHTSKVMFKILKPGFNSTWTVNFQMFKLDLEKAEEPEIKLPTSTGSSKKQESSIKISTFALLTTPKPLTVWITTNCGKFWKRWECQTTWPASWEICMQVKKQQLELDWNNRLIPNRKKSMSRLYIVTLLI